MVQESKNHSMEDLLQLYKSAPTLSDRHRICRQSNKSVKQHYSIPVSKCHISSLPPYL